MNPLLVQKLKQDLRTLRLKDMADILDTVLEHAHEQSHLQFLSQLVHHQLAAVNNRSLDRRLKRAQFPHTMRFDTFDWNFQPGLNPSSWFSVPEMANFPNLPTFALIKSISYSFADVCSGKIDMPGIFGIESC